jgi:hypothetical protein
MRLAARHLACVFLLIASVGVSQAHASTSSVPGTAGGRFVHALLWHSMPVDGPGLEALPTGIPWISPERLQARQKCFVTAARELAPPVRQSISVHRVTSSLR